MGRAEERVIATGIRDIWGGCRLGEGKVRCGDEWAFGVAL